MILKALAVGPMMSNCFILGCERTLEAAVIDPGDDADKILLSLAESKLTAKYIINTHSHFDHVGGNKRLKDATGADILIHSGDAPSLAMIASSAAGLGLRIDDSPPADRLLEEGDTITIGHITLAVIHTPGHSPGGISLHTDGLLFAGDSLFAGSIGRTDFPGGDHDLLVSGIRRKLYVLADDTVVLPGHNEPTTIGREKSSNPFVP